MEGDWTAFEFDMRELLKTDAPAASEDEGEILDRQWSRFIERDQLLQASGRARVDPRERLRTEHLDPERQSPFAKRSDMDQLLAKGAGDRRRTALLQWLRGEVALGKTASELIAHARRHDLATGNLLAEVAAEL